MRDSNLVDHKQQRCTKCFASAESMTVRLNRWNFQDVPATPILRTFWQCNQFEEHHGHYDEPEFDYG